MIIDKGAFNDMVANPNALDREVIEQLEATIKAFPYCQISYSLLAKASSLSGSEELEKAKPLAAAYALSRIALQQLVENNDEKYDTQEFAEITPTIPEEPIPQDGDDIIIALVSQEVSLQTQKSEEQRRQQQIIEGFMKKNPKIMRQESNVEPVPLDITSRVAKSGSAVIETEAFAKILLRQGKIEKAIDVYQKLILKNPEKRNYFAKKLSELYHIGN